MNNSGLVPKGRAVLVQPYQPNLDKGMIVLPDSVKTNQQAIEQRAIVIDIGTECWIGEKCPRAYIGDKVLVSAYAGYMAVGPKDGKQYRFINDRDIFATIIDEGEVIT